MVQTAGKGLVVFFPFLSECVWICVCVDAYMNESGFACYIT